MSCDIGRVEITKREEKGSASVILCGCAPTPGRSLHLQVCLCFKLQWEVQVTAVETIHLFICSTGIRLCWTLGIIFAAGSALKHSHWHKIQLYNLHEGLSHCFGYFHLGRLLWLLVKYLSLGTQGTCDSEIRPVFLAEDRTFKGGGGVYLTCTLCSLRCLSERHPVCLCAHGLRAAIPTLAL